LAQNRKQAGGKVLLGSGRRFHPRSIMPLVCEKLNWKQKTATDSLPLLQMVWASVQQSLPCSKFGTPF
jgi:hypothetical protein